MPATSPRPSPKSLQGGYPADTLISLNRVKKTVFDDFSSLYPEYN
jgi:hypothetical protein